MNKLASETSLYLQQHANNPVNWYPWGSEALQKAKSENKMILLSVGYSSCHWCHVMEHESFENEEIASIMNNHYISIKVDREERPDIDAIYMEALQMMTGQGGWPLNVWLTPDLIPIYGGTYFPPETTHSRPGFADVLVRMANIFNDDPEKIKQRAHDMHEALKQDVIAHIDRSEISLTTLRDAVNTTQKYYDEKFGGFSSAPKFPASMHIEFLLRYDKLVGDPNSREMALFTLRKMCLGGIYDQLGGGFHRYSTDSRWLVPHFEKMLYDNALLISVLCDAYQVSGDVLFEKTLAETVNFIRKEMTHSNGAFFASIDADSDGVEGAFYVWKFDELQQLLPEADFPEFSAYYDVFKGGNWEENIILNRTHSTLDFSILTQANHADFLSRVSSWKEILLDERSKRNPPVTDKKIITSWNALMLKFLCKYWFITLDDDVLKMIHQNADYLKNNATNGTDVYRITSVDGKSTPGFCDDYALLSEAFCMVFKVTGDESWLKLAKSISTTMIQLFYNSETHSFSYTRSDQEDLIVRKKDLFDNVTPSANSAAIQACFQVGKLTGDIELTEISTRSIESLGSILSEHALSFSYLLQIISDKLSHNGSEIVILGSENEKFLEVLSGRYLPFATVVTGNSFEKSEFDTFSSKISPQVGSQVYICKDFTCQKPIQDLETFRSMI